MNITDIDLEAILRTFVGESEEHLTRMEEALINLEAHPEDQKSLEAIFRGAHTIKGNSAGLGFGKVAEFAHAFEDLLQRLRTNALPVTQTRITLLLRSIDALRQMIPDAITGAEELPPNQQALLNRLTNGDDSEIAAPPLPQPNRPERRTSLVGRRREDVHAWIERADTVRVDIAKLDRMLNLAGEIAVAHGRLRQVLQNEVRQSSDACESHEQLERLSVELQEQIMKVRMVPVGPIFRQYLRTVRDIAQANGKAARLALEGEEVEIDLSMVEHLKDPLTHMIRNALDHGIEAPETRRAKDKDPSGLITLKAYHDGASIVIQIIDDGAGLNRERIAEHVRSLGMNVDPSSLSEQELFKFIFEPGFSTAEKLTDLSGRGVGMDVVRRNIEALRGAVTVDSHRDQGTSITIRLPLTLAIIEGFSVGVADQTYILPLYSVRECLTLPSDGQQNDHRCGVIDLRGAPVPYLRLRDWYALPGKRPARESVVVVEENGMQAGLAVDQLFGAHQTVIKPLGAHLKDLPGVAGSAILGSGRVALIVDVGSLMREVMQSQATEPNREWKTNLQYQA
jgi:two-component system chemotaxis sensor kinase CheA